MLHQFNVVKNKTIHLTAWYTGSSLWSRSSSKSWSIVLCGNQTGAEVACTAFGKPKYSVPVPNTADMYSQANIPASSIYPCTRYNLRSSEGLIRLYAVTSHAGKNAPKEKRRVTTAVKTNIQNCKTMIKCHINGWKSVGLNQIVP